MEHFTEADLDGLWEHDDSDEYTEPAPSDEMIARVEAEFGYRLPPAYLELARVRNGGVLRRDCFPIDGVPGWAPDHVAATGIYAIGATATFSLLDEIGAVLMRDEWEYPADVGFCFADTPTAGHTEFMFDYRACGPQGEPAVVSVDQEGDFEISFVAPDFASFIRGLVTSERFEDDPAEVSAAALDIVTNGTLSPIVSRGIAALAARRPDALPDAEASVRAVGRRVVSEKGGFHLHADDTSHLMYAAMFLLYSELATARSFEDFARRTRNDYTLPCYELMIPTSFVADPYTFKTVGWAPGFVGEWWDASVANGSIVEGPEGFRFTPEAEEGVLRLLRLAPTMW